MIIEDLENGPWRTDKSWVSHYHFAPEANSGINMPAQIAIHDSTLRDGEQAPGVVFSLEDKLEIARGLSKAGIQFIEAGFPAVSEQDRKALEKISSEGLSSKITCLCRAMEKDIDLAADCGVWGAIIEIPVSYPRLKYQFGWTEETVIEKALRAAAYAKEKGLHTYLFMIDSTRAREEFLEKLIATLVSKAEVDRITVVDTGGCIHPRGMGYLVKRVNQWVDIPIEVHCHNDFGLGVANTLAGLENGAVSASCTISSIGQRAGNTSTEEIAMAIEYLYGVKTGIDFPQLFDVAERVQKISGWQFPPNKPITGKKIFTWEAGIPVAALMKNPHTVEPFQPSIFNREHHIEIGKKSGKANIVWKLQQLGLQASEEIVETLLQKVKEEAGRLNRVLKDGEFTALLEKVKSI